MEYCALGDLSLFIKRRDTLGDHRYTRDMIAKYPNPKGGALNEVIVRHFLKQLSSALKFLRERHLIHRDIKPQNLLLCPSPSSYRHGKPAVVPFKGSEDSYKPATGLESLPMLKIADFGFARSLPATSLAETLCGSPLYMAPEILRYEKYDAKADLWSVGTVLYEMVVGKPPFRAANHVELLHRIEKGEDRIKFPEENPVSSEIKALIRLLLKQNPVERLNFVDFFENPILEEPIPGVVAEDASNVPAQVSTAAEQGEPASRPRTATPVSSRREKEAATAAAAYAERRDEPTGYPSRRHSTQQQMRVGTPPASAPMHRIGSAERPMTKEAAAPSTPSPPPPRRPNPVAVATAPGRQEFADRHAAATAVERQRSRKTHGTSAPADQPPTDPSKEQREWAAQEVAFERDYVVVEKRAVEVNAFADELAHNPRIRGGAYPRGGQPGGGALPRRSTTPGTSAPVSTSPQGAAPGKAMQVVPGRSRVDSTHVRQNSYERRYAPSPTSAISKALNMASGRLFGVGFSPPMAITKGGRSPPLAYNPFPAYPSAPAQMMLAGDPSPKATPVLDEEAKIVQAIEECATRSDVVYGFAEVKYKQLIPLAPSMQPPDPRGKATDRDAGDSTDGGLTVDAVVTLSEEALVLYVKALSLLAKSMDIAGAWWSRKNRGDSFGEAATTRTDASSALVGNRINNVVQWVRSRFNEVLEKAEFVRLKLLEGQRRLPPDHPNHPGNLSVDSTSMASGGSMDVVVSPGVTAEKLMYDRALEMSRAAAINELTSEDLAGCEIAYVTAIRMLEAVLDEEDDDARPTKGDRRPDEGATEDRQVVMKRMSLPPPPIPSPINHSPSLVVSSIRSRLASLRKKLAVLAKRHTPPSGPSKGLASHMAPASPAGIPSR